MNKRIRGFGLFFVCFLQLSSLKAQYVSIPDFGFLVWLNSSPINNCMNAGSLDTTCQALLEDTIVVCNGNSIHNLFGIQFFKNLRYLNCSDNLLDSLPPLSDSLRFLNCQGNYLTSLPKLPSLLMNLSCTGNSIASIPTLPPTLLVLNCAGNLLTTLPVLGNLLDSLDCSVNALTSLPSLPGTLVFLKCRENQITSIPQATHLKILWCDFNQITSIPFFSDSLQTVQCNNNLIQRLPPLPASLKSMYCQYNQITDSVIIIMPSLLTALDCTNNRIKWIGPLLPDSLIFFLCGKNQLTFLPPFPNIPFDLDCGENLLTYLPDLPDSVHSLGCENNPNLHCLPKLTHIASLGFYDTGITCLPNYGHVGYSQPALDSVPLCDSVNINGCLVYASMSEIKELSFTIYPNPASDEALLSLNDGQRDFAVEITNVTGQEVRKIRSVSINCELPVKGLSSGLYFVRVNNEKGKVGVRKLMVVK